MERQGIQYLLEYGETGEQNVFIPIGTDIQNFIRKFYPHIPLEFELTQQGEPEDGIWVRVIKTGYEDMCVFLPTGDADQPFTDELRELFRFFFNHSFNFMKLKPPR